MKLENELSSQKIVEKIKWYIRAHGHSSIGGLNIIWTFFEFTGKKDIAEVIQDAIHLFEGFGKSENLKSELVELEKALNNAEKEIKNCEIEPLKKDELLEIFEGVKKNLSRIHNIMQNPNYCEHFSIDKILFSTIHQLLQQYPNTFFGDFIKPGEKDSGEKIRISISQKNPELVVECCGYELQLLFFNMLSNAADAIISNGGKGRMTVETSSEEQTALIKISDDGKPISLANLKKINNRQLFSTKGKGHGRGLKIIYDILQNYNGTIAASYDKDKKILEFVLTLPLFR